jgi:hypothetical protein
MEAWCKFAQTYAALARHGVSLELIQHEMLIYKTDA